MSLPSLPVYLSPEWFAYMQGADAIVRAVENRTIPYVPQWTADTAVSAGAVWMSPSGETIVRNASGTTRPTYDATEQAAWTVHGGNLALGTTAGTALDAGDIRLAADQDPAQASVRTLGTGVTQAAPGTHTHSASQISDSSSVGRTVLTATDAAAARAALGVGPQNRQQGIVYWEENGAGTAWGASRPSGYKRVVWSANGSTSSTDPSPSIALVGDIWERPA